MSFRYVVITPEKVETKVLDIDAQMSQTEFGSTLLTTYQQEVGGYVEVLYGSQPNPPPFDAYVNEEGLLRGLPQNKLAFAVLNVIGVEVDAFPLGPVVVTGPNDESLQDSDIQTIALVAEKLAFE